MIWVDILVLQKSPALPECAIFLPQRKMKNEAGGHFGGVLILTRLANGSRERAPPTSTTALAR